LSSCFLSSSARRSFCFSSSQVASEVAIICEWSDIF
jgi:hypothetical protein